MLGSKSYKKDITNLLLYTSDIMDTSN